MSQQNQPMSTITTKTLQAVADYLTSRPYAEVAGLVAALVTEAKATSEAGAKAAAQQSEANPSESK